MTRRGRTGAENDGGQGGLWSAGCASVRGSTATTGAGQRHRQCSPTCWGWIEYRPRRRSSRSVAIRSATSNVPSVSSDTLGRLPADWHLMPVGSLDRLDRSNRAAQPPRPHRHDRRAPSARHLRCRVDPHAAPIRARRGAHPVGGRRVQPCSIHDADRVDQGSCSCRVAHRGTGGGADAGVGVVCLVPRCVVRHRHGAVGEQLRRTARSPRRSLAFLVHRSVRPTDPRRHRTAGGAGDPAARAALPLRVPARPVRLFDLLLRMEWAWMGDWYNIRFRTHSIAFFFVLGWLIQRSDSTRKRLLTSALCVVSIADFFDYAPAGMVHRCLPGRAGVDARDAGATPDRAADGRARLGQHVDPHQPFHDLAARDGRDAARMGLRGDPRRRDGWCGWWPTA